MARRPSLADADAGPTRKPVAALAPAPVAAPVPVAKPEARRAPSRVGRKGVAFWIDPDAARQLRVMAAEEDRTTQSLMEEALDLLFANRGKNRLARTG
jgi:hypothetical protein